MADLELRTSESMLNYSKTRVKRLAERFEQLVDAAKDTRDPATTSVHIYELDIQTAEMIAAAEDLMTLTRQMKEAWVFGKLDTLGPSPAVKRSEEEARRVAEGLEKLRSSESPK